MCTLAIGIDWGHAVRRGEADCFDVSHVVLSALTSTVENGLRTYFELSAHNLKTHKGCADNSSYLRSDKIRVDVSRAHVLGLTSIADSVGNALCGVPYSRQAHRPYGSTLALVVDDFSAVFFFTMYAS